MTQNNKTYLGEWKVRKKNGIYKRRVKIYEFGRNGTDSPKTTYFWYRDRWISPYEQQKYWKWDWIEYGVFYATNYYKDSISDMVFGDNPLLARVKKKSNDAFAGNLIQIPLIYDEN